MAHKIVVTRRLPATILSKLGQTLGASTQMVLHDSDEAMPRQALLAAVPGASAILCTLADKIDAEVLRSAGTGLKVISTMSVGYSHIDMPAALAARVRIGYTPDVLTEATADLALALALAACRRVGEGLSAVKGEGEGGWTSAWKPFWLCGRDLYGAKVGIVGLGRIGTAIARRLRFGFACEVHYHTRGRKEEAEAELNGWCPVQGLAPVAWQPSLDALLASSDVVILICALTPETRGLMSGERLRRMRPDAVLVNVSRGEVVDQGELVRVLQERPGMRAGLDVCTPEPLPVSSPLLALPNCLVLPHIGSASVACRTAMAQLLVDNALAGLQGADMPAEVEETRGKGF